MARLASEVKMGFYPTDLKTIEKIVEKIKMKENSIILDPCAGEGEAINFIAQYFNSTAYAVELDKKRAIKCSEQENVEKTLNADAVKGVRKSIEFTSITFLNPPYDNGVDGKRLELAFLERYANSVAYGGLMIFVINPSMMMDKNIDKMMSIFKKSGYKFLMSIYDKKNQDYKNYGQFFIILKRISKNFRDEVSYGKMLNDRIEIDQIEEIEIEVTGKKPTLFREIELPEWKLEEKIGKSRLKKAFFQGLKKGSMQNNSIEVPNEGQNAILIAAGALNKKITLNNGDEMILKGTSNKYQKVIEITNEEGQHTSDKYVDQYSTVIYALNLTQGVFEKFE